MPKPRPFTIRCPICTTMTAATRSGRVCSHLNPGGVKCFATGMNIQQGLAMRESIDREKK
jgi:hypothetical protein